jgi:hypothetical protein
VQARVARVRRVDAVQQLGPPAGRDQLRGLLLGHAHHAAHALAQLKRVVHEPQVAVQRVAALVGVRGAADGAEVADCGAVTRVCVCVCVCVCACVRVCVCVCV